MTTDRRARILIVTRNLPPLVGGMERLNWHMAEELSKVADVRVIGPDGAAAVAPAGVSVREAPLKPLWKFLLRARALARREARTWQPDIVLAGSGLTAPLALHAARACGARTAVYVHGLDVAVKHPVYRAIWFPALRRMDRVIANSHATAELCRGIGIDPARIGIVHPGVDLPDEPLSHRERGRGEGTGARGLEDLSGHAANTDAEPSPAPSGHPLPQGEGSSFEPLSPRDRGRGDEPLSPRDRGRGDEPLSHRERGRGEGTGARNPEDLSWNAANTDAERSPAPVRSSVGGSEGPTAGFRQRHNLSNRPLLLSVGRLSTRKGLREFVMLTLPQIVSAHPDTMLLIVGDAPTQALHAEAQTPSSIQSAADAARVGANLKFLGTITDYAELGALYCAADVHVFPVREIPGDPEGFGMVAVEAAAHGLPTVAFATGGVIDAVAEGASGCLVAPGDYAAFAEAVVKILGRHGSLHDSCVVFASQFAWQAFGAQVAAQLLSGSE